MIKHLLFVSLFSMLMVGPALADPATYRLDLKLDSGRRYVLSVVEDRCGSAIGKFDKAEDNIRVCPHRSKDGMALDIDWSTREGDRTVHVSSSAVVPVGGWVELDATSTKLTVSLQ